MNLELSMNAYLIAPKNHIHIGIVVSAKKVKQPLPRSSKVELVNPNATQKEGKEDGYSTASHNQFIQMSKQHHMQFVFFQNNT